MKTFVTALAAATTLALALPAAANTAPWMTINQRQASLDQRIDQGVRTGALTRPEAMSLRSEFQAIARIESDYRHSGHELTGRERADLDHRFDVLSRRIYAQKHDSQVRSADRR